MDKMNSAWKSVKSSTANAVNSMQTAITGRDKYADNLLGESLLDTMRKATAKTLDAPDTAANQQASWLRSR